MKEGHQARNATSKTEKQTETHTDILREKDRQNRKKYT